MRIKSYASALVVGGLVLTGGLAAGPGDEEGHPAENGCRGVNEASQNAADQAQETLDDVKEILDGEERCDGWEPAGNNGNRPGDDDEG